MAWEGMLIFVSDNMGLGHISLPACLPQILMS